MANRFSLRKRTVRSPHYPKKVAGYPRKLKRELHKAWKVASSTVPVDDSGMCAVKLEYGIEVKIPSVPKHFKGLRGIENKLTVKVLHAVLIALEEAMANAAFNRAMNKFVAESVLIRMRLSLLRWGIKGDLLSKLAVTHGNPKISGVTGKSVIIAYPITIHMPFYGAYLDAGRGGAKRAGYLNPATGNSEFYDALYVWAEKTLAVDDAHLDAVVIRIYDNINTYGGGFTKPRMFLIGSLNYIAAHETIDARFEESIEPYLEKNLNRELKGLKP